MDEEKIAEMWLRYASILEDLSNEMKNKYHLRKASGNGFKWCELSEMLNKVRTLIV